MQKLHRRRCLAALALAFLSASSLPFSCGSNKPRANYDLVIRNGQIYDGLGGEARRADLAVLGGKIVAVGQLEPFTAKQTVDAKGMAVAPGFINMLSWATMTILKDPRALSDVKQGVTLEIFGEGASMGPLNAKMQKSMQRSLRERLGDPKYVLPWKTLAGYLEHLAKKGVGLNVASFVGATTLRIHEIGYADREQSN